VNAPIYAITAIDTNVVELDGASSGEIWPSANSTKANAPPPNSADAIGFNFSASAPLGGSSGTGAGAGKIEFVPMVIWKHPDAGSPKLLQAALTGEAIKSGTLNVQQPAGSKLMPYTEIL